MTTMRHLRGSGRRSGRPPGWGFFLAALPFLALAGCDFERILEVDDPDVVLPETVDDPSLLPAVHAAAIGDFTVSYVGNPGTGTESQILISGLVADEFIHTGTFDTRESIDRRLLAETNPHVESTFRMLHRARVSAERAADGFARFDANTAQHAEMQNLVGYTYLMFAENYCSGVPFSRLLPDGSFEFGEPETTTQVFERAVAQFQTALTTAGTAGSAVQQNLARVGRARALLGLGRYDQAAEAAADVPTGFQYLFFHSETTARQNNGVWSFNNNQGRWSIADREGGNGLPYRSEGNVSGAVRDPRIPTAQVGLSQRAALRGRGEHWAQLKYPQRVSSTVLANGIEARLIEAEAALRQGAAGLPTFLARHNALRASVGLPGLNQAELGAMTQRQRENLHFKERAYWLWLTSRRLGDLRRMMWDYGRRQDEIFPIGSHHRAGTPYGDHTSIPIPFDEQNNPRSAGCLTRDDAAGRQ